MSEPRGPTIVVEVEGDRREGDVERLQATLRGLLAEGYKHILVNVAQATYIDSVLLGAIVQGYVSAMRVGTTVKLLHASRRVKELLVVTKLDRVLKTVESADER